MTMSANPANPPTDHADALAVELRSIADRKADNLSLAFAKPMRDREADAQAELAEIVAALVRKMS